MKIASIVFGGCLALTGVLGASDGAVAVCQIDDRKAGSVTDEQQTWPSETQFRDLTREYNSDQCVITSNYHKSGSPCLDGESTWHIQVVTGDYTYHVFDYEEYRDGRRYRCATRTRIR